MMQDGRSSKAALRRLVPYARWGVVVIIFILHEMSTMLYI